MLSSLSCYLYQIYYLLSTKIASVLYEYIPYKLLLFSSLFSPVILLSDIVIKLSLVFIFFPFDNVKTDIMFVFASVFPPTIISLSIIVILLFSSNI